ncbi:MAG: TIR domain-containing protein [Bacteroidetes bacterium]|nr:TIR domain-containing protein [Bacteroidota bacterium]
MKRSNSILQSWQPNVDIFRDERKVRASEDLSEVIKVGLNDSKYLIVIASRNSADSASYVSKEIKYWYEIKNNNSGGITGFHLILLDGLLKWDSTNNSFSKESSALPKLDNIKFNAQPIWVNINNYCKDGRVQTNNSNYEWEIAKVKGLLLDKNPDEIIDEVSKGKRVFRITVGFVISILIALSAFAFYLRGEAVSQKEIAEQNAREAEKQRDIALNNLIKFKVEEFDRNLKSGSTFLEAEAYCFADSLFSLALGTANDTTFRYSISDNKIKYLDSVIVVCKNKSDYK